MEKQHDDELVKEMERLWQQVRPTKADTVLYIGPPTKKDEQRAKEFWESLPNGK